MQKKRTELKQVDPGVRVHVNVDTFREMLIGAGSLVDIGFVQVDPFDPPDYRLNEGRAHSFNAKKFALMVRNVTTRAGGKVKMKDPASGIPKLKQVVEPRVLKLKRKGKADSGYVDFGKQNAIVRIPTSELESQLGLKGVRITGSEHGRAVLMVQVASRLSERKLKASTNSSQRIVTEVPRKSRPAKGRKRKLHAV